MTRPQRAADAPTAESPSPPQVIAPAPADMRDGSAPAADITPAPAAPPTRSLRRIALLVLGLLVAKLAVSMVMERRTPSTSQAVVQAYVVAMAAEVPGRVSEVAVVDNARVSMGDVLFRIDPQPYQLAVQVAEAQLERIGQSLGASVSAIEAVQARVVDARASRDNVQAQAGRSMELVRRGVYPQARYDEARAELDRSNAQVAAAEAELERARRDLGPVGENNPQLREALANLERARLDLTRTAVVAPGDGAVTNLQLAPGQFVAAGHPALTFLEAGTVWMTAGFKENSLENVRSGNEAEVVFDTLPGRVFTARVESIAWGVSSGGSTNSGLPTVRNESGWVREPQRFPVRLVFDTRPPMGVRYGSQASVVIYTGDNPVMNALGAFWVRIISMLTYVS